MENQLNKITELVEEFNNSGYNFKIDLHLVKRLRNTEQTKFIKLKEIMSFVCEKSGLTPEQIRMNSNERKVVLYRQICHYMARHRSRHNLVDIGAYFGNKDHSTVIHSSNTIQNYLDTDKRFKEEWGEILNS